MSINRPTVVIVGAGITGLMLAYRYRELGIPFVVLEKASTVGGVWRDNVYPGVSLDTAAATYCLPFAEKFDWTYEHAPGGEVQDYLLELSRNLRLDDHIRFDTEVKTCRWADGQWTVEIAGGETITSDALVMATGFLRVPAVPEFAGRDLFTGPQFHSAEWDTSVDPTGKRVAIIGTGSSGMQITTALSEMGCDVTQIIRTPQWIHTRPNHRQGWLRRRVFHAVPALGRSMAARRDRSTKMNDPKLLKNGDWRRVPGPAREAAFRAFSEDLEARIPDPVLRAKLTPSDTPGCKRIPLVPDYYDAVQRPNVSIVRGGVERITEDGVIDSHGDIHEVDIIVYATGFDAHAYFKPIEIFGLNDQELGRRWTENGPDTYLSLMAPDFPNLFVLHGPYSAINSIPIPLSTDEMIDYTVQVIRHTADRGVAIAPSPEATAEYLAWVDGAMDGTIWAGDCNSWYKTAEGRPILWPFGRKEHTEMLEHLDATKFVEVQADHAQTVR